MIIRETVFALLIPAQSMSCSSAAELIKRYKETSPFAALKLTGCAVPVSLIQVKSSMRRFSYYKDNPDEGLRLLGGPNPNWERLRTDGSAFRRAELDKIGLSEERSRALACSTAADVMAAGALLPVKLLKKGSPRRALLLERPTTWQQLHQDIEDTFPECKCEAYELYLGGSIFTTEYVWDEMSRTANELTLSVSRHDACSQ